MKYFWIAWARFKNALYLEYRYPLQALMNAIGFVLFIYLLSIGANFNNPNISKSANIISVLTGLIAAFGLSHPLITLGKSKFEIQEIYLQPISRIKYILASSTFFFLQIILTFIVYTYIIALFLNAEIQIPLQFLFLSIAVYLSSLGLGLVLVSFRIVFQRMGALINFISLIFIGSAVAANPTILRFIANYSAFARALLYIQTGELSLPWLWGLTFISLIIGIISFAYSEKLMFKRALLALD